MSDTPVYMITNFIMHDADAFLQYEKGFFPILKKHGGSFVAFDDNHVTLEGVAPRAGRIVLFQFPSEQTAKDWYNDPEYQALSEHRRSSTELQFLTMIHGMPPRG